MFLEYLKVFITGGLICSIGQLLIDKTKLTPARILVIFVTLGAIFAGFGFYQKLIEFGKAGATVPISGFGNLLTLGVMEEIDKVGFIGIFTGGIKATAAGICSAIVFGYVGALAAKPKIK